MCAEWCDLSWSPNMTLGERRECKDGSYELRCCVDNRFVFRIRNRVKNTEDYVIWTEAQWRAFEESKPQSKAKTERNEEIFQRHLKGETFVQLAAEFGVSPSRVSLICANMQRKAENIPKPSANDASAPLALTGL